MNSEQRLITNLPCWKHGEVHVKSLRGGMTNIKYLVTFGRKQFVTRFLGREQEKYLRLDRNREVFNTRYAHKLGFAPGVFVHYPQHRLLIVDYVSGKALNKSSLQTPRNIYAVGRLLARIHSGGGFRGRFSVSDSIASFERQLKRDGRLVKLSRVNQKKLLYCLDISRHRRAPMVRCHVDPMPQNFIKNKQRISLIDWEYASMGDSLWDLAFVASVGRFSVQSSKMLLMAHGTKITPQLWHEFCVLRALVYYREALWGLTQLERSRLPANYRGYIKQNLTWFLSTSLDKDSHLGYVYLT